MEQPQYCATYNLVDRLPDRLKLLRPRRDHGRAAGREVDHFAFASVVAICVEHARCFLVGVPQALLGEQVGLGLAGQARVELFPGGVEFLFLAIDPVLSAFSPRGIGAVGMFHAGVVSFVGLRGRAVEDGGKREARRADQFDCSFHHTFPDASDQDLYHGETGDGIAFRRSDATALKCATDP